MGVIQGIPSLEVGDRNDYFFDFEFFDTDNDGTKELVTFGGALMIKVIIRTIIKGGIFRK